MGDDDSQRKPQDSSVILPAASVVLQPFIAKLGHNVEEIRVRALKNILFKLEHKLICIADLVQERDLLIRLLEWFNQPSAPLKRDVLKLLAQLSKHVSAAQALLNIGAIEFMSQLRQNAEPELYQDIDIVIQQLLSLPQNIDDRHDNWCLYKGHDTQDMLIDSGPVKGDIQFKSSSCPTFSKSNLLQNLPSSQSIPQLGKPHGFFAEERERLVPSESQASMASPSVTTARSQDPAHFESQGLTFFQWLPLSLSDRHILTATDSRLQSHSPTLVAKSCEFLSDVLFKDFPAEIFLQRPSVFRSLLDILESRLDVTDANLALCALHCLKEFCCHVKSRLMATSDPALFCPNPDCWKSSYDGKPLLASPLSREGVVSEDQGQAQERVSGDGGQGSNSVSPTSSQTDMVSISATDETEDDLGMEALQYGQISVEEACLMVLSRSVQVMMSNLGSNTRVVLAGTELIFHVGALINMVMTVDIWNEDSRVHDIASALVACLKSLGEAIAFSMRKSGYHGNSTMVSPILSTHRLAVINLTIFTVQLMKAVVPLHQTANIVPAELVTVLSVVSLDGIIAKTHPSLHANILQYLTVLDSTSHQVYQRVTDICLSIYSTCAMLKSCLSKPITSSFVESLSLLERSLPSLPYHRHMDVVREGVKLCSAACIAKNANPNTTETSRRALLTLMAHYDLDIRLESYKAIIGLVAEALRVSHVTYPMSTVCHAMLVLIDARIIHQICRYGLYDANQKIQEISTNMVENLLLGRLSMSTELWRQVLVSITPSLAILEGFIGHNNTLDQCVLDLVTLQGPNTGPMTADGKVVTLLPIEQLRGSLRLLFAKDPKLRSKGLEAVVWFMMTNETHPWGQTFFRGCNTESLRDVFIVDLLTAVVNRTTCAPRPDSHVAVSHPSVERSEISKLWEMFSSRSVEWSIRKSAAEQLGIILQDPHWHSNLLTLKADEVTLELLKMILTKDGSTHTPTTPCASVEMITPCLKILRLLVEFNWSCRKRLARDDHVYTIVTMATVTCQPSAHASYEGACLLTLLLFDEEAGQEPLKDLEIAFSLPGIIVKSYQLPFNPPVHNPASQYQVPIPREPDPVKSDPGVCMLRLAWNLAWHESLDKLCGVEGINVAEPVTSAIEYWHELRWRALDSQIIRCSYTKYCILEQLRALQRAASHHPALVALRTVRAQLLTDLGSTIRHDALTVRTLNSLQWQDALERYLQVLPNSIEDDELLTGVLKVMCDILTSPSLPPVQVVTWMIRVTVENDGPPLTLLRTTQLPANGSESEQATDSRRSLRKALLAFISTLVKVILETTLTWRIESERIFIGDVAHAVALNLDLADNPQYYELPVLESALECLGHMTSRSGWSSNTRVTDAIGLCTSMVDSLVQVLSAFHAGRLGSRSSFMGKGVTFHAGVCLTHLAREMQLLDINESWASYWTRVPDTSDQQPLTWLVTLWSDRSAEVRWMGLSVTTSLATTEAGQGALLQVLQGEAGGVFAVALSILLNDGECGMVRQQSALLLCNLIKCLDNSGDERSSQAAKNKIPHPSAQAIQMILDYAQFHEKLSTLLTSSVASLQPYIATSSRACSVSASSTSSSGIPYKPLASSSRSVSVASEAPQNALHSPSESNGVRSPGEQSTVTLSSGSLLSNNASVMSTAQTQTPMSVVPLINERGLPSGMSTSSSDTKGSAVMGSVTSSSNVMTSSSLTPGLLSALAQLVRSLVTVLQGHTLNALKKNATIEAFYSHLDSTELQAFLQARRDTPAVSSSQTCAANVVVREVLHMYTCLVHMTHVLARVDHTLLYDLQQDSVTMHKLLALLAIDISFEESHLQPHAHDIWLAVSGLLIALLQAQGHVTVPSVTEETIYKFWSFFTDIFVQVVSHGNSPPALRNSLLRMLSLLLLADGKRSARRRCQDKRHSPTPPRGPSSLVLLLDESECKQEKRKRADAKSDAPELLDECESPPDPSGTRLCRCLMTAYDNCPVRAEGKHVKELVRVVLAGLLAVSLAAKRTSLKAGFTETTIEQIKLLHVQLNMDSLQLGRGPTWKRKENPLVDDLVSLLDLLRNFAYQFDDGKAACVESGLIDVLHKLWSWCTVDHTLRTAVLALLSTLTARHPRVAASIAGGSSTSRASQSGSTLLNSLLKTASSTNSKILSSNSCPELEVHLTTHRALFTLLANLMLSAECRGIMWKSNFLQQFSHLKPLKTLHGRPKHVSRAVGGTWLSLLVNLSFFTDGQAMLMKVPGCISVLLEFCHVTQGKTSTTCEAALLVLRNICFHGNSKAVLLSNEALLEHLIHQIDSSSDYLKALCVSALWSLVTNCQKLNVFLWSLQSHVAQPLPGSPLARPAILKTDRGDPGNEARVSLKNAGLAKKLEELRLKSDLSPAIEEAYKASYYKGLGVLQASLT